MNSLPLIPGYKIIDSLGRGGMADVYLGVQQKLGRHVAIKVMNPLLSRDEQFSIRFMKEARTAAQLNHPNIITIHDVDTVQDDRGIDYHFIVMERLQESLSQRLKKRGSYPPNAALEVVKGIAAALTYAHEHGFIHRDIKPDNIMFRSDGSVVVVDFGIARAMGSVTQLTQTGTSIGTPHYMSPEQCRGEKVDGRSDLYSLGILFYEMLMGEVPYKADSTAGIIIKHLQEPTPVLPSHLGTFQPLLAQLMAKDKERRIQDGKELSAAVNELAETVAETRTTPLPASDTEGFDEKTVPTPTPPVETQPEAASVDKKKWLLPVVMSGIIVILGTAAVYFAIKGKSDDHKLPQELKNVKSISQLDSNEKSTNKKNTGELKKTVLEKKTKETARDEKENRKKMGDASKSKENRPPRKAADLKKDKPAPQTKPEKSGKETKSTSFSALPQETQAGYKKKFHQIRIQRQAVPRMNRARRRPAFFNVTGILRLRVNVNEDGKVSVVEQINRLLKVNPPKARHMVLNRIRKHLENVSLQSPTDRDGKPIQLQLFLSYKVETRQKEIILTWVNFERIKERMREQNK